MLIKFLSGFSAGLLISIGGTVYLACDNKIVGAVFFSVALLCICYKGYSLYTGKIGYAIRDRSKDYFSTLFFGLAGNVAGTVLGGLAVSVALPDLVEKAAASCDLKLAQSVSQTFLRALFCGVLMYLAVSVFAEHKTPITILFCIPTFILSGFEHCVADMFYFSAGRVFTVQALLFIALAVAGNTVGSLILPLINPKERVRNK